MSLEQDGLPWYESGMVDGGKYHKNIEATAILVDAGIALMRQNLKRHHPEASDATIDALLGAWLHRTSDPIPGDIAGPVRVREWVS